jgi:hypothetical protein
LPEDPFAQADAEAVAGDDDEDFSADIFDLSDIEEVAGRPGAEIVPNGTYPFRVETAEYKRSSKGNMMFAIQLKLQLPDSDEYTVSVWTHPTLSQKQIGQTKHIINILTEGRQDWSQFRPTETADAIVGAFGRAKVRQQNNAEYGKSMNVQEIYPAAEAMGGFAN